MCLRESGLTKSSREDGTCVKDRGISRGFCSDSDSDSFGGDEEESDDSVAFFDVRFVAFVIVCFFFFFWPSVNLKGRFREKVYCTFQGPIAINQ